MRSVTITAAVFAVLVVWAAACGGGDDDEGSAGAAERSIEADAQEHAEAAVLQLSDFPDGWRATPPEEDEDNGEFRECLGVDFSTFTITGEADSDDFSMGQAAEVSSEATVFASVDEAAAAYAAFVDEMGSESLIECIQPLVEEDAEGDADVEYGDFEIGELSFTPPAGSDEAGAWQIAIPAEVTSGEGAGLTVTAYLDIVSVREEDTVVLVGAIDVQTPFDPELRDQLVTALAGRAR